MRGSDKKEQEEDVPVIREIKRRYRYLLNYIVTNKLFLIVVSGAVHLI